MLLEFYGKECGHCFAINGLIDKLEKELNLKVERYETWHNEENAHKQAEYDKGLCGGVPFFFNTDSKEYICGETDYTTLVRWAKGEKL